MKLQSGESVKVDILGSAEKLVWDVIAHVLWLLAFVAFVAAAPVLYFFFGLFCARSGSSDFPMIYVFTSPLPVALWTMFVPRWLSVRQWRREGRELGKMGSNWREANGGWTVSILKSFLLMFIAGFFSFAAQMSAVALHWYITGRRVFFMPIYLTDPTPTDLTIFWSLMPLVAFSPIILLFMWRWLRMRNSKTRSLTAQPSLTIPEQITEAIEAGNTQRMIEIARNGHAGAALVGQALEIHWREKAEMYRNAAQGL